MYRGYPQANVSKQREADERTYGVRRTNVLPSAASKRPRRAPATPAQNQNAPTPSIKRGRTNSFHGEASSDISGTPKVKRAARASKEIVERVPVASLPADDFLAQLKVSFDSTYQRIKDGITDDELSVAPLTPPPPVEIPLPAIPADGQAQGEDLNFPELIGKYRAMDRVGEGAFGAVYKVQRLATHPKGSAPAGQFFAVKRIAPVILPLRIVTEIRFLRTHGGVHHVIRLEEVLRSEQQISIVFPLFDHDPWPEFYWKLNVKQTLSYMHQLLEALAHIHNSHLIHRDVKPTNCLYKIETNELMLIDFGFAEFEPRYLTSNVSRLRNLLVANRAGTRGFRAPEVLLSSTDQTSAVDIWSAGVLLLSILTARHPFFKNTTRELLGSLCEIAALFGTREIIALAEREKMTIQFPPPIDTQADPSFTNLEEFCRRYRSSDVKTFEEIGMPQAIFDLLTQMLRIDPKSRITAREALAHPVFAEAGFEVPEFFLDEATPK